MDLELIKMDSKKDAKIREYARQNLLEITLARATLVKAGHQDKQVITVALYGFKTFADAKKCQKKLGGIIVVMSRTLASCSWYINEVAHGPIRLDPQKLGQNWICATSADAWWKEEYCKLQNTLIKKAQDSPSQINAEIIRTFFMYGKLYDRINSLQDNEQICYREGYPETAKVFPIKTMEYWDEHNFRHTIAVCF